MKDNFFFVVEAKLRNSAINFSTAPYFYAHEYGQASTYVWCHTGSMLYHKGLVRKHVTNLVRKHVRDPVTNLGSTNRIFGIRFAIIKSDCIYCSLILYSYMEKFCCNNLRHYRAA